MKRCSPGSIGVLFSLAFLVTSSFALTSGSSATTDAGDFCNHFEVKKIVLDALNGSAGFKQRKMTLIDFQDVRTLSTDIGKNAFSCRGVLLLSDGKKFAGILTMAAKGDKTDIDWFDDDATNGLANYSGSASPMPPDEAEFIRIVLIARSNYESANTDFAKGATRPQRAKAICAMLKSTKATNWIGKIVRLTTNGDGKGVLAVEPVEGLKLRTFSVELADIGSNTLVEPDSRLFGILGGLSVGDQLRFSGSFISDKTDCVREMSLTMRGSLTSPEFAMKFIDAQKISY